MPNLTKIEIRNFRGLDNLEIDKLSKINLFVGKNNSGKTSILEALFLLFGMSNPSLSYDINLFREISSNDPNHLSYLFHKLTLENKPSFYGKFENGDERELKFEPINNDTEHKSQQSDKDLDYSTVVNHEITGIKFNFSLRETEKSKTNYTSSIFFQQNKGWVRTLDSNYKEKLFAAIVLANEINNKAILFGYSEIVRRNDKKDKEYILKSLQAMDPNIEDIKILSDGIYFELKNVSPLVPINIIGDGVRRLLDILTVVILNQSSFVCIDEIENGLHFSAYALLWKGLLDLSEKYDVQLFITTHNLEIMSHLKRLLSEKGNEDRQSFVKIFTIAKTKNKGYQSYGCSYAGFENAIDNGNELRN